MNTLSRTGFVRAKQNDQFSIYLIDGNNKRDHICSVKNYTATKAVRLGQRILKQRQSQQPLHRYQRYIVIPKDNCFK